MDCNQLKGKLGDELNVIFAIAFPMAEMLNKQVWKRKSERRKEPFLKRFFFLASGFCIIDSIILFIQCIIS